MAIAHAEPGQVVDLLGREKDSDKARTTALVKTEKFEAIRLIVRQNSKIATHQVDGPITLSCLAGRVRLGLPEGAVDLSAGDWTYLDGGVAHSVEGIADAVLLLTIVFP